MKKLLLGSTALAAAGLLSSAAFAADPLQVTVTGYYQDYAMFGSWDNIKASNGDKTKARNVSFTQEGEVHFNGRTKLDNGMVVGFRIELEAYSNTPAKVPSSSSYGGFGDQIDEHYIFFDDTWGRIEYGATNGASDKMAYNAPSAMPGFGYLSKNFDYKVGTFAGGNKAASTAIQGDRSIVDANKITYYTPRFSGIQLGVSYTPLFHPGSNGNICGATGGSANPYGVCPKDQSGEWQNAIQGGINYLGKFNSLSLALYGGAMYADYAGKDNISGHGGIGKKTDNWWWWMLGTQVTYQGFSFGGHLAYDNNATRGDNYTWMWGVGGTYSTGPWQVGLGWEQWHGRVQSSWGATKYWDDYHYVELGANYKLGPGITLVGGVVWYLQDSGQPVYNQASKIAKDNASADAWAFVLGTSIAF